MLNRGPIIRHFELLNANPESRIPIQRIRISSRLTQHKNEQIEARSLLVCKYCADPSPYYYGLKFSNETSRRKAEADYMRRHDLINKNYRYYFGDVVFDPLS